MPYNARMLSTQIHICSATQLCVRSCHRGQQLLISAPDLIQIINSIRTIVLEKNKSNQLSASYFTAIFVPGGSLYYVLYGRFKRMY